MLDLAKLIGTVILAAGVGAGLPLAIYYATKWVETIH